jgi:hypothetical protein
MGPPGPVTGFPLPFYLLLDGLGDQRHAPAALPPGKTRYPLYRRLGGVQSRPRKILCQTMSQTEMASFQLFSVPLIYSVIIKGTPDTPTFFHCVKTEDQLLGWRLKLWNLLEKAVIVVFCSKRQSEIATYYSVDGDLVYWNNIQELMEELRLEHTSEQWRLFIGSSKVSLKAVLLYSGNNFHAVPLARAVHI